MLNPAQQCKKNSHKKLGTKMCKQKNKKTGNGRESVNIVMKFSIQEKQFLSLEKLRKSSKTKTIRVLKNCREK